MTDKTAIIYARVSSAKQAEEELPISSQIEQCRKKAESLGANIIKVYSDEGISGSSDKRPAFQDAMLFCEIEPPTYLITWSSSRFARNKVDAGFYKKRLATANVKIMYVSMEVDTDTTGGWLLDGVMEIFDELYSRQVSADTRRSLIKNAKDGYWNGGRVPYGFIAANDVENPKRKRLAHNPDEVDVVRKIFDLKMNENMGGKSICIWLSENGYKYRGSTWKVSTVQSLLRNKLVIGKTTFGKRDSNRKIRPKEEWIIVDSHKPIIDSVTWDTVQKIMDSQTDPESNGSPKSLHTFTGLLTCGQCGSSMHTESAKGKLKRFYYYNCSAAAKYKKHKPRRINSDAMDKWLLQVICETIFSEENLTEIINSLFDIAGTWLYEKNKRLSSAESRLLSLKQKQNNLYDLLELHGLDAPNLGDLSERLKNNNEKAKIIEQEIAIIDAETPPVIEKASKSTIREVSKFLTELIITMENPKKVRALLGTFIESIVLKDTYITVNYNPNSLIDRTSAGVLSDVVWLPEQGLLGTQSIKFTLPLIFHKKAA